MTPPNQAAMEQAMELHTHDVSRVLVAEMVAASREMSDEADRTEALDELTTEANKLDAVHKALLADRKSVV